MEFLKTTATVLKHAVSSFSDDNGFQHSAAISFYTLFSLAPVVMIAVYLAGMFVGDSQVLKELSDFLEVNFGTETADAVLVLVDTIQTDSSNFFYLALSLGFLIISATTIFVQFKDSFNRIFKVKSAPGTGFIKVLIDRAVAFGMIVLLGAALILSLILDSVLIAFFDFISTHFESVNIFLTGVMSNFITAVMMFIAISSMFYLLPDVVLRKRPLILGSLITTILLMIGKFGVGMIIGNSSLNQLSGASSSVIILMLWVYYSSIIIFFGIELVKALAEVGGSEIKPGRFARIIRMAEKQLNEKEP